MDLYYIVGTLLKKLNIATEDQLFLEKIQKSFNTAFPEKPLKISTRKIQSTIEYQFLEKNHSVIMIQIKKTKEARPLSKLLTSARQFATVLWEISPRLKKFSPEASERFKEEALEIWKTFYTPIIISQHIDRKSKINSTLSRQIRETDLYLCHSLLRLYTQTPLSSAFPQNSWESLIFSPAATVNIKKIHTTKNGLQLLPTRPLQPSVIKRTEAKTCFNLCFGKWKGLVCGSLDIVGKRYAIGGVGIDLNPKYLKIARLIFIRFLYKRDFDEIDILENFKDKKQRKIFKGLLKELRRGKLIKKIFKITSANSRSNYDYELKYNHHSFIVISHKEYKALSQLFS